jgi:ribonuclease Z
MIITGTSVSGLATRLHVQELKLTFDIGDCPIAVVPACDTVCITHGHMDHVAGAPYLAAIRALGGMTPPTFYIPAHLEDDFRAMMDAFGKLDGHPLAYKLAAASRLINVRKGLDLGVYPMVHRVPSVAYGAWVTTKKLRPDFVGLPGAELGRLRKAGTVLDDEVTNFAFAYTGDTTAEGLDNNPVLYTAKTLAIEVTFMGDDHDQAFARERGHLHLTDIIERANKFLNEEIVFVHHSARYSDDDKNAAIAALPESLRNRCRWL